MMAMSLAATDAWLQVMTPQSLIQKLAPLVSEQRLERFKWVAAHRRADFTLLLHEFYDPHNISAVVRSADAFGVGAVHVVPHQHGARLNQGISMSAEKWIEYQLYPHFDAALNALTTQGYQLIVADVRGEELSQIDFSCATPWCLVMGSEKHGMDYHLIKKCARAVRLPMYGFVDSFNVSVAAALLMQHILSKKPQQYITEQQQQRLVAQYLLRSIPHVDKILQR